MEKSAASGKKISNKCVYVLIQYNNDDNHDAYVLGAYKSLSKAKDILIENIHEDFVSWVDCGGDSFDSEGSSDNDDFERQIDSSESDIESKSASDDYSQKTPSTIIKDLHKKYPHALSAPKQRESKYGPGFDKRNWEHVKPLIIKELDEFKGGCEYINNPYGYKDYKISRQTVK